MPKITPTLALPHQGEFFLHFNIFYPLPWETVSQLEKRSVIPAEAGIQSRFYSRFEPLDARLRGHDEL